MHNEICLLIGLFMQGGLLLLNFVVGNSNIPI